MLPPDLDDSRGGWTRAPRSDRRSARAAPAGIDRSARVDQARERVEDFGASELDRANFQDAVALAFEAGRFEVKSNIDSSQWIILSRRIARRDYTTLENAFVVYLQYMKGQP